MVGQLEACLRSEDHEIAALARLDTAHFALQAERGRAAHGHRVERLVGREPHLLAGQRDDELQVLAVAGAGIEVGGERDGGAGVQELPRRRERRVQRVARAGKQDRRGARRAQRRDVLGGRKNQMVGRHGAELRGERGAAAVRELLGVDLEAIAVRHSRLEDAPRLSDREGALVAEDVDELRLAGERRRDVTTDVVDELVVTPRPLGGQGVGGELRVDAIRRMRCLCRGEQLGLVLEREPVAGLDLERGRAVSEKRVEAAAHERRELRL